MRCLVYCVFNAAEHQEPQGLLGVCGRPVFSVTNNGLGAAISMVSSSDFTPHRSHVLAYGKVVESLHEALTVIPVRYGCLFDEQSEVIRLLGERNREYKALLKELEGCVEMAIRIFLEDSEGRDMSVETSLSHFTARFPPCDNPGRAYLRARKAHYAREEQLVRKNCAAMERCQAAFAGLFVKCSTENRSLSVSYPAFRAPLASFYFLVRREDVESFRAAFRRFSSKEPAKLLLSGPWPPYNFAQFGGRPGGREIL